MNNILDFIKEKKNCTGCSACLNICPVNCITMEYDEEGFLYPVYGENCIKCDKCKRVCPILNEKNEEKVKIKQIAMAAVTKSVETWKKSSSGGAFTEICNAYGDDNTIVFGATFDNLKVKHSYVIGVKNIDVFRKSKYIQSDLGNSFKKVYEFLKQDKKVIFSGTPCQISGLRSYLGKNYENLLCIDLICHGVGSQKVFDKIIKFDENKYGYKIKKYTFRYKKVFMGNFSEYSSEYIFEDNKSKVVNYDNYNKLFLSQLCLRNCCQDNCKFRTSNRLSDITIADFKNKIGVFPNLKDYKNYSTIVINSKKGLILLKDLKKSMDIIECDLDIIKKNNPLFYRYTNSNKDRDKFFYDFKNGVSMDILIDKYCKSEKIKFPILRRLIPYKLKYIILKKF
ncbi:Coenzyme F420 hydrogenase/dehydrogenase, beta subunit C-terminal domain [Clostridium perfringens]|uniref:Coenzyme F420 hydrogenase/dehydrogenase, beta subunit C-terminal domain n=1 Tax=Clostridium perfringens TaxID=1502 RepID=UPI0018E4AF20|nr:Coenzyme F420 hydrogenase/dehydrogenase, beta subunit C-terminal domain [Clostridium perfringens]EIF6174299.1 Coenzyme F420 hydrogenase/dehydrogenase, beta subunit C-terminal domain [Clostridium perfringens]MBI6047915.1 Coenzyme F420 hydrogenase/dehydrogenase, beta subunit C-terminal domain [Clostridium perfringens]MDM0806575.1 Coenzyme F420 hydrogenase/dehydrogenase, beta subunit C-terminal domain [Clostridium perfringens]